MVTSRFLCSINRISDNSKTQLPPSIKSHELWCQARELLLSVSLGSQMPASKRIPYFSHLSAAFGFQNSTPPDTTVLNASNVERSVLEFQTGTDAPVHTTLETEQLTSHEISY